MFETAVLAVEYVASGDGLALVDETLFEQELAEGRLVKPFETTLDDGYGYYLITHPDGLGDPAIAFFRSWLIRRFGMESAEAAAPVPLRVVHG